MKRFLGVTIMAAMSISIFTACGGGSQEATQDPESPAIESPVENENDVSDNVDFFIDGDFATGLGIITSTNSSRPSTEDANGHVQVDSAIAAITVDPNGIIVDATIDAAQARVEFDNAGQLLTPLDSEVPTKHEQGADYGMADISGIGAEWYQQINDLTDWMINRTIDEVLSIPLSDDNRPIDLTSSVTISIDPTMTAVDRASRSLVAFDAPNDNIRTGIGVSTSIGASRQASDDEEARVDVTSTVVGLTLDENDTILATFIDSPQSRVSINNEGVINSNDLSTDIPTKGQLGDNYGMIAGSSIELEWHEQIATLSEWMVGKTVDEVRGLSVSEDNRIEDTDLASSVTIRVDSFLSAFEKAVENANR